MLVLHALISSVVDARLRNLFSLRVELTAVGHLKTLRCGRHRVVMAVEEGGLLLLQLALLLLKLLLLQILDLGINVGDGIAGGCHHVGGNGGLAG